MKTTWLIFLLISVTFHARCETPDTALDIYATPGERVNIGDGRRLNLRCKGSGAPTIILEAGAVADSMTWSKLQPLLATVSLTCSYDRAGYGFSSGGAGGDYIESSTKDLHALIAAAHLPTPAVFVGHSLGSDIVRDYATRFPQDIAAIVLLDPPPQKIEGFSATRMADEAKQRDARFAALAACETAAKENRLDKPDAPKGCLRGPNPEYSDALNAAQHATKIKPAFWAAISGALHAGALLDTQPVSPNENHGGIPLLILQPDAPFGDEPPEDQKILDAVRIRTQRQIAATSSRSEIIPVAHSSHDVQMDQPDAVVAAVRKAIAKLQVE